MPQTPAIIYLTESGKLGIFTSPNYGGYDIDILINPGILYNLCGNNQTYLIELTVKNMDGNGSPIFYNKNENKNIT